jgi:hypothetical protein
MLGVVHLRRHSISPCYRVTPMKFNSMYRRCAIEKTKKKCSHLKTAKNDKKILSGFSTFSSLDGLKHNKHTDKRRQTTAATTHKNEASENSWELKNWT